ncbi:hypothetical protein [Microbacterium capsulatum]|uniref:Uncharacterized protein n=1 Tax=Microbacterium capsulatum TaxID=3041921 RepID=A0ABU0XG05_9MICO|nr:hypothetical protein [Microbacterium sp. ASV81]MDQ4214060.1 hypothetical protein [Microbacterium sp. ASV81]
MGKDVKGMPLDLGAELMKLSALVASAETGSGDQLARAFSLRRLAVLDHIIRIAQKQIADLVHELRELPVDERGKWSEIGDALGKNPDAARAKFMSAAKPRRAKHGLSIADAAQRLGLSPSTVYSKIRANPNDEWFALVPTNNGRVIDATYRILDLDGLDTASTK